MLYRNMKKADRDLSILGFGCMRLPVLKDGHVDEPEAIRMIRHAIDNGVNYVDTAYPYHNGESETVTGNALGDGYREKVNLATKLPSWLVGKRGDMDKYLDEQLKKLQTDHIDFYLVHALGAEGWEEMESLGIRDFLDDAIEDGRINYAGFSFHDRYPAFKKIVDAYDWTFCQIQYNYMDERYQAGTAGLHYAAKKGLGVVIMEPLRGGLLARQVPAAMDIWARSEEKRTPAEWGLRWVWDHPEVSVVLSGMSTMEQVKENLAYADKGLPQSLKKADLAFVNKVKHMFRSRTKVPCTGCGYCQPCPNGVDIPSCFSTYNIAFMYEDPDYAKTMYQFVARGGGASKCVECGECESICPQKIEIQERLKEVKELFKA
jgi:predicted aldo/keto reductase-like oxidoreductase